jgi:hypothetical protein
MLQTDFRAGFQGEIHSRSSILAVEIQFRLGSKFFFIFKAKMQPGAISREAEDRFGHKIL